MNTTLVISFTIDGLHSWPNAPKQYEEFSHPHRHLFKFICWGVTKDSSDPNRREKELWGLRQEAIECIGNEFVIADSGQDICNFLGMSCEGIADWLKNEMGFSKVFCGEEWFLGAIVS